MVGTLRLRRALILSGMALSAINLWTGAPLLALWVGSRAVGDTGATSMFAVLVIVVVLLVTGLALVRALGFLGATYDRLTGRPPGRRRQTTWLKPMSAERTQARGGSAPPLTALEYVLIGSTVGCVLAFEVWFFFFAGSSLPAA